MLLYFTGGQNNNTRLLSRVSSSYSGYGLSAVDWVFVKKSRSGIGTCGDFFCTTISLVLQRPSKVFARKLDLNQFSGSATVFFRISDRFGFSDSRPALSFGGQVGFSVFLSDLDRYGFFRISDLFGFSDLDFFSSIAIQRCGGLVLQTRIEKCIPDNSVVNLIGPTPKHL